MKKTILLLAILTICASVLAQKNRMEQEFGKRSNREHDLHVRPHSTNRRRLDKQ